MKLIPGRHLLSLAPNSPDTPEKQIDVRLIPFRPDGKEEAELAMNVGANYAFIDTRTDLYWLPERTYEKGSWGVVGGEPLYVGGKVGTKEDILAVDEEDPLYQTMRVNPEGFGADLPDGTYEIELLMVDDGHRSCGILFRFGHARGANHHIVKLESGVLQMALCLHLQRHEQRKAC